MIRHAVAEGWSLLKQRWIVSLGLSFALTIPICLAGISWSLMGWIQPVVGLAQQAVVIPVLLHPHMDEDQRRTWLDDQRRDHPEWRIEEVSPDRLAQRLARWFPYLGDLLEDRGNAMLSYLVEISTSDPDSVDVLSASPAVIAVGPRSTIRRSIGRTARALAWILGVFSGLLLMAASLFASVWVHLELYRHADEITIMRLVGATESAIRGPFLVATLTPGVVAAVVAVSGSLLAVGWMSRMVAVLGLPRLAAPPLVLLAEIVLACGLPLTGALVTLQRHAAMESDGG